MIVDIIVFQDQALEVLKELEATQKILLTKVENVQDHFWVIDQALNNICLRERERIYFFPNYLTRSICVVNKRKSSYGFQVVHFRKDQR
jgi:hypothetical protein